MNNTTNNIQGHILQSSCTGVVIVPLLYQILSQMLTAMGCSCAQGVVRRHPTTHGNWSCGRGKLPLHCTHGGVCRHVGLLGSHRCHQFVAEAYLKGRDKRLHTNWMDRQRQSLRFSQIPNSKQCIRMGVSLYKHFWMIAQKLRGYGGVTKNTLISLFQLFSFDCRSTSQRRPEFISSAHIRTLNVEKDSTGWFHCPGFRGLAVESVDSASVHVH